MVCPSIFDARNGGSGAAYWRAPLHGGRPRAALRVQPSCSRVCSPPAAAGSHAPRSLGDGRRVLALSSHLLSLASIARDGSPPWERTKAKQTGNALVGESAPSTGKRCGRAWLHPVNRTAAARMRPAASSRRKDCDDGARADAAPFSARPYVERSAPSLCLRARGDLASWLLNPSLRYTQPWNPRPPGVLWYTQFSLCVHFADLGIRKVVYTEEDGLGNSPGMDPPPPCIMGSCDARTPSSGRTPIEKCCRPLPCELSRRRCEIHLKPHLGTAVPG